MVVAALPTAETLWPKPENGALGAVQVVVVVAGAPVPEPAVAMLAAIDKLPVEPIPLPPLALTVPLALGV